MTTTLKTLLSLKASAEDTQFPVTELFHRPGEHSLRFAALDVGGWLDQQEVLIALDRFEAPGETDWPVAMSRDEVEAAPAWGDAPKTSSWLPPLVVGPFGMTFSPLLASAQIQDSAEEHVVERDRVPEDESGRVRALDRASRWIGCEAVGPDGALGQVEDVLLDDALTMTHLETTEGGRWPLSRLRPAAEEGKVVFD